MTGKDRTGARRRRGGLAWGALASALAASTGCAAHLPVPGERVAFLERSTVSLSSDRTQAFEVDPALHLLLWNGLEDDAVLDGGGVATVGAISFLGQFRLLRGASTPVRTPTYEPRARVQVLRAAVLGRGRGEDRPPHRVLGGVELFVGHRSNGENGCALADHTRYGDSDFACTPNTDPPVERLNVDTGSFTTNYAGIGLVGLWAVPRRDADDPRAVLTAASSVEWNVGCDLGACMPAEMRDRYGVALVRWSADAELPALFGAALGRWDAAVGLRGSVSGTVHAAAASRRPFGDASAEVALVARPRHGLATGLFVRRHEGSDPLNIRFEERLDAWFVGLSLEPENVSFRRPGPRP